MQKIAYSIILMRYSRKAFAVLYAALLSGGFLCLTHAQNRLPKERLFDEFYIDKTSNPPAIFIGCLGNKAAPAPSCTEVFNDHGLLFEVHFNKKNFSQWREIRDAVAAWMQSFAPPVIP